MKIEKLNGKDGLVASRYVPENEADLAEISRLVASKKMSTPMDLSADASWRTGSEDVVEVEDVLSKEDILFGAGVVLKTFKVGTIRERGTGKFKKMEDGSWKPHKEGGASGPEPKSEEPKGKPKAGAKSWPFTSWKNVEERRERLRRLVAVGNTSDDVKDELKRLPPSKDIYSDDLFTAIKEGVDIPDSAFEGFPSLKHQAKSMRLMRKIREDLGPLVIADDAGTFALEDPIEYKSGSLSLTEDQSKLFNIAIGTKRRYGSEEEVVKVERDLVMFLRGLTPKAQEAFILASFNFGDSSYSGGEIDGKSFGDLDITNEYDRKFLEERSDRIFDDHIKHSSYSSAGLPYFLLPHVSPSVVRGVADGLKGLGDWDIVLGSGWDFRRAVLYHPDPAVRKEWRRNPGSEDIDNYDDWVNEVLHDWLFDSGGSLNSLFSAAIAEIGSNKGKRLWVNRDGLPVLAPRPTRRYVEFAKRLYEETQEFYKRRQKKKIHLHRGVGERVATHSAVESWSTMKSVATEFANDGGYGVIMVADVDPSSILMSWESHALNWVDEANLRGKKEFTLLGGSLDDVEISVWGI